MTTDPSSPSETLARPAEPSLSAIARPTFLAWERLRLVYIVVLGILTLLLVGPAIDQPRVLMLIGEGAIAANLCYFAGPIAETYVRWLGYEAGWVRWALFLGGTVLSAVLAVEMLAFFLLPGQN